jgi:hypothetical protein
MRVPERGATEYSVQLAPVPSCLAGGIGCRSKGGIPGVGFTYLFGK